MKNFTVIQKVLVLGLMFALCASTYGGVTAMQPASHLAAGTIQALIDAAPVDGTVNILAGTYSENLTVTKNLTLIGVSASETILQPADTTSRVITVSSGSNLTLQNLRVTGGQTADAGGGIYLAGGSLSLNSVQIDHNQAAYGGGVFQEGVTGSVTAVDCMIRDNSATLTGGGIYTKGSATLTNTTLANNTAGNHGGGLHVQTGTASLTGGSVYGNHALNGNGGGVNATDGLSVVGTDFDNNKADGTSDITGSGGALSQYNADKAVSISWANFNGNSAQLRGGAVYIQSSFLNLRGVTFTGNQAGPGGETDNTYGGGVYAGGGVDGSYLIFTSNSAKYITGNNSSLGGGLYIQRPSTSKGISSISFSTFDGNLAWFGSAISSGTYDELTLINSAFINNGSLTPGAFSGYGGGVHAHWVQGDQLLFQNNRVLNSGGGIAASHILLTNSRFLNNVASLNGGGIYAYEDLTGTNLLFGGNDANIGAALFLNTGPAVLKHITIGRPTSGTGSAVFVNTGGNLEMKNSILSDYDFGISASGTVTEDYNLFFNNGLNYYKSSSGIINNGAHNLVKDPLFAAPAAGDYHLLWPSPAIGLGTDLGVDSDLDGRARVSRWDSGAYQYSANIYLPLISK